MKTFRWTVPELPRSRAEKKNSEQYALKQSGIPTKDELDEHCKWEEDVAKRGRFAWIIRVALIWVPTCTILLLLRSQDILISRNSSITPLIIGLSGGVIGTFISWHRYKESRQKIRNYIEQQGEQGGVE